MCQYSAGVFVYFSTGSFVSLRIMLFNNLKEKKSLAEIVDILSEEINLKITNVVIRRGYIA
jgi:hypothetical protein